MQSAYTKRHQTAASAISKGGERPSGSGMSAALDALRRRVAARELLELWGCCCVSRHAALHAASELVLSKRSLPTSTVGCKTFSMVKYREEMQQRKSELAFPC